MAYIKNDADKILADIEHIKTMLTRGDLQETGNAFIIQRYLDNLSTYAEAVYDDVLSQENFGNEYGDTEYVICPVGIC